MRTVLVVFILLIIVTACAGAEVDGQQDSQEAAPAIVQASITPSSISPSETPSPTVMATASTTPAPTFTATPTPTTVPVIVVGDPRAAVLQAPIANDTSACGLVDLLDFPLEAPHGSGSARGGTDFGIFRRRYDKYHAGEDWWMSNGRSSLGAPIYSIGHGRVTYAEPLGWGRDQGVIIVRHYFADGRVLLSFYGHLDPESFEVRAGDCVARGDMIAKIGKPKTGPHLHFEVRSHMPLETGTGYWWEDPTVAGWRPPSATIWNSRMSVSPGVFWTQSFATEGIQSLSALGEALFLVRDGDDIVGLDTTDGHERWRLALGEDVEQVLLNSDDRHIYSANQLGEVTAFALPDEGAGAEDDGLGPLWKIDLDAVGIPELLPLPGGGLVLASWGRLIALSAEGGLLWVADLEARPFDWLVSNDTLIISTTSGDRSLWSAKSGGLEQWDSEIGGHLAAADDNLLLYDGSELYRLDPEDRSVESLFTLQGGNLQIGDVAALPDGGAIISHADPADRQLIAVDAGGEMLWERSIAEFAAGKLELFVDQNRPFLVPQSSGSSGSEVSIFTIDLETARLTHLFSGGTRNSKVDQTRLFAVGDDRILININGRSLTAIDTQEAEEIVSAISARSR